MASPGLTVPVTAYRLQGGAPDARIVTLRVGEYPTCLLLIREGRVKLTRHSEIGVAEVS